MAHIIGISGKARAGKDTLFSIAEGDGYVRLSFADDLKARARKDFGLTREQTDGALKEVPCAELDGHTPREFLIDLGNLYRKYRPSFWVDTVVNLIKAIPDRNYMITDVRYPNEAEAIKSVGGLIIRIERHPDRDGAVSEKTKESISETALDDYTGFDYRLAGENNRVLPDLIEFWQDVLEHISTTK